MPLLELLERCADVGERESRGDRHVKLAFGDQSSELRQGPGVLRLLAALGLTPYRCAAAKSMIVSMRSLGTPSSIATFT